VRVVKLPWTEPGSRFTALFVHVGGHDSLLSQACSMTVGCGGLPAVFFAVEAFAVATK
jgi:hypothetical protein